MPPPSQIQEMIDLTDNDDDKKMKKKYSKQMINKTIEKYNTQRPRSTPPVPILSQKDNSPRTQTIIDITDDDDDDFVLSTPSFSYRPKKKLKLT
jgi:hypothetical protein